MMRASLTPDLVAQNGLGGEGGMEKGRGSRWASVCIGILAVQPVGGLLDLCLLPLCKGVRRGDGTGDVQPHATRSWRASQCEIAACVLTAS